MTAQVVNGDCPLCEETSIFVSLHQSIYKCLNCGGDIEQKINGKISYIAHVHSKKDIKLDSSTKNG
tara:strand:+ start:321 stop:518 length:198 start_codon:yes stop_codon:yes gene_type:complete